MGNREKKLGDGGGVWHSIDQMVSNISLYRHLFAVLLHATSYMIAVPKFVQKEEAIWACCKGLRIEDRKKTLIESEAPDLNYFEDLPGKRQTTPFATRLIPQLIETVQPSSCKQ